MTAITLYKMTQTRLLVWAISCSNKQVLIEHGEHRGKQQLDILNFATADEAATELDRRVAIKKTKQGYTAGIPTTIPQLPMLAQTYDPDKLPNLVYVQPKLDGIRCVGSCNTMLTRRGERINSVPHIMEALAKLPPGIRLDGELYCHGVSFQEHLSIIKRDSAHGKFSTIQYHVFDVQVDDMPYSERYSLLFNTLDKLSSQYIVPVKTILKHKEDVPTIAKQLFSDYEGAILRDPNGMYLHNHRSIALQKYKWTDSAECQIVDIIAPKTGRSEGAAIFICRHPDTGQQFKVVPKMPIYLRQSMFRDKSRLIGYWARVTYEKLSDKGVPLKPRAEAYAYKPEDLQ